MDPASGTGRVVARNLPFSRTPWLIGGAAGLLGGVGLILIRHPVAGWAALLAGAALVWITARPAYTRRDRIVLDDNGVTDLATPIGPVPWSDIVRAELRPMSTTMLVLVEVTNPEFWEARLPQSLRRVRQLAADLDLPPVVLLAPRLDVPAEEIVRLINQRARGRRP